MQKIEIWLVDTVAYSGVIQLMVRGQVRGQTVKDTRQRNSNHSSNIWRCRPFEMDWVGLDSRKHDKL